MDQTLDRSGARAVQTGPGSFALPASDFAIIVTAFVGSRLILVAIALFGLWQYPDWPARDVLTTLCRWDCRWYVDLSVDGYHPHAAAWATGDGANWPFFPIGPMLNFLVQRLTGLVPMQSGFVVSTSLFFAAVLLFYYYGRDLYGAAFGRLAAVMLALWPFAIHASVPMSESSYLPLAIATLLLARRRMWIAAGLAAAVLSATRAVGFLAFLPMLYLAVSDYGWRRLLTLRPGTERAALALALSGFGLGLFIVFQYHWIGDGLAFSHIQASWNRQFKLPWMMMLDELNPLFLGWDWILFNVYNLVIAGLGLALIVVLVRRRLWPEVIFGLATIAVGMTAGQTTSLPRFTGALVPVILAAVILIDRPRWRLIGLGVSALLMVAQSYIWVTETLYAM